MNDIINTEMRLQCPACLRLNVGVIDATTPLEVRCDACGHHWPSRRTEKVSDRDVVNLEPEVAGTSSRDLLHLVPDATRHG